MRLLFFVCILLPFCCLGQSASKLWLDAAVKGDINKKWDWSFQLTNRFGDDFLETSFFQTSFRFKVCKFFRASLDYRGIIDKDDFRNYVFSNRLNVNGEFRIPIKQLTISSRARYQFGFSGLNGGNYDSEFDQAVRIKPELSYNIKDFFFQPSVSVDLFFDPSIWDSNPFVRYRLYAGGDINLKGPHEIGLGYIFDQQVNVAPLKRKHVASLSYSYNFGKIKKKKKKD